MPRSAGPKPGFSLRVQESGLTQGPGRMLPATPGHWQKRYGPAVASVPSSPLSPFQSLRFLAFPAFFFLAFCSTHQTFNARLGQTSLHNSDCITNSLLFTHAPIENIQSDEIVSSSFVELLVRPQEPPLTTLPP